MGTISAKHIKFIKLVAKGTTYTEAYLITFHNKTVTKSTARVQGSILAKKYATEIQQAKEKDAKVISDTIDTNTAQIALKSIVSQADADAKAFRILGENDLVVDYYYVMGKPKEFTRKPTPAEIQKAYENFCKRFGSNAATKIANTNTKGEDIEPQVFIINGKEIKF